MSGSIVGCFFVHIIQFIVMATDKSQRVILEMKLLSDTFSIKIITISLISHEEENLDDQLMGYN